MPSLRDTYTKLSNRFQKVETQLTETSSTKEAALVEIDRIKQQIILEEKLLLSTSWVLDWDGGDVVLFAADDINSTTTKSNTKLEALRTLLDDCGMFHFADLVSLGGGSIIEIRIFSADKLNPFIKEQELIVDRSEVDRRIKVHQAAIKELEKYKAVES